MDEYRRQLEALCRWNRRLARENADLACENRRLSDDNTRLVAQAEASESLLDAAMDEALKARRM